MNYREKIIGEIETHSIAGIKECFDNGVSPNDRYRDKPLINELTSEYARTPRFADCVRLFVEYGMHFEDQLLLAVLLNDPITLHNELLIQPEAVSKRYTLQSAYTPLHEVTLMHICAEFNHVKCADVLVNHGANVNATAGTDQNGFGGQTPVFHTVNQNSNNSIDMLNWLLAKSADLKLTVPGIIWGKGYEWETFIPAVNPISYAMMGRLPQMHRNEATISNVVSTLLKHSYGIEYTSKNIPNAYLKS